VLTTTPPPSRAEVTERVELHLYSRSAPSWPVPCRTLPSAIPRNIPSDTKFQKLDQFISLGDQVVYHKELIYC